MKGGVINISGAVNLALHAMVLLARNEATGGARAWHARDLAKELGTSYNHLSKVLQRLVKCGLVYSERGPRGGFRPAKAAGEILLLDIYEAFEGEFRPHYCLFGRDKCLLPKCILGDFVRRVNDEFEIHLKNTRLSDFLQSTEGNQR